MIRQIRRMTPKRNPDSLGSIRGSRVGFGGSPKHSFLTEGNKENEESDEPIAFKEFRVIWRV
jgi:hypothetical protein